jgi:Ras-related protein Rab-18
MNASWDIKLKIVIVGYNKVGKGALQERFYSNTFNKDVCTIGVDFKKKIMDYEGKDLSILIFKSPSTDGWRVINSGLYREVHAVFIVFSCTDRNTFDDVERWVKEARAMSPLNTPLILVCNKVDIDPREVTLEEGQALAKSFELPYFEVSSENGVGVMEMFMKVIKGIMDTYKLEYKENEKPSEIKKIALQKPKPLSAEIKRSSF